MLELKTSHRFKLYSALVHIYAHAFKLYQKAIHRRRTSTKRKSKTISKNISCFTVVLV